MTHRTAPGLLGALVPFLCAASATAQVADHLVYSLHGDSPGDRFGHALSACGDVDGDGLADFIVGARFDDNNGFSSGNARVFSGADARILYSIDGDSAGDELGYAVSGAGDVDRDGRADFIVGAPLDDDNGTDSGSARVYSGRDGHVLYRFDGDSAGDHFGFSVSGAGDVDGDGHADLVVGAHFDDDKGTDCGSARVFSGKDGSILYTFYGDSAGDQFGEFVRDAGDVDRDGHDDVIAGAPFDDDFGADCGSARVLSGKDGSVLRTFFGNSPGDQLGISVGGAGDVDGDSYPDLVVASWNDDIGGLDTGSVLVYSGRDGSLLHTFVGDQPGDHLGWRVSRAGDVNGDGFDDVISGEGYYDFPGDRGYTKVWSGRDGSVLRTFEGYQVGGGEDITGDGVPDLITGTWLDGGPPGLVWVYSGAALTLSSDIHALAPASGGSQTLRLNAGSTHAGRTYAIFGSVSGTLPGVRLPGLTIPLNPDFYTTVTGASAPPFLVGFSGTLDTLGRATASLNLPPLPPAAAFTMDHAFVVYDAGGIYLASNPVSLRVE